MKYKLLLDCLLTTSTVLFALTIIQAQNMTQPNSYSSGEDVILQWNRVLQETIRTPGQQPPTIFPVRSFAMMHASDVRWHQFYRRELHPLFDGCAGNEKRFARSAAAQTAHDV